MVMGLQRFSQKHYLGIWSCILFLIVLFSLPACGGSSPPGPKAGENPNAPLTVWVDATRLPGMKLYQTAHPNAKLNVVVVDRTTLPEKIQLFNRAGSGWPDVVFAEPDLIAAVADKAHHYPADLTPYVSQDVLNKFASGSLASCTINGKLYCLRNDLAQDVLWYNAKLLQQFGYSVPTTWEDYQALGLKVVKEHPGYVIGSFGDASAYYTYFTGSGCPTSQTAGADTVRINMTDSHCIQMANLLDPLIASGAIAKIGAFDPGFVKLGTQNKILMFVGPSWFGPYVFKTTYKTPNGELAAALPLRWASESSPQTGYWGGSSWAISSHSDNPKGAADVAIWMSTNNAYQATAPTFPAYLPAADAWEQTIAHDGFYTTNLYPVLKQAAGMIDPTIASVRYDPKTLFGTVVIAAVLKGQTIGSTFSTYQSQMVQLAQASGYTVVTG